MADRRMFSKAIVLSDVFLELPHSAQALYYNLSMNADDDGFVGNPKSLVRLCGCKLDDLNILLEKKYILGFKSGVICIKHWKMNNYIQKDRYKSTTYQEELAELYIDEKGAYTKKQTDKKVVKDKPEVDFADVSKVLENKPTKREIQSYILSSGRKVNVNEFWEETCGCSIYRGNVIYDWKGLIDKWIETDIAIPLD